jgi:hypothetical protein
MAMSTYYLQTIAMKMNTITFTDNGKQKITIYINKRNIKD